MTIAYFINGKYHYITFLPIKYDVYYKQPNTATDNKRKLFTELLKQLGDDE
jgi:hypothetical protein